MAQDYYVTPAPQQSRLTQKTLLLGGGLVVAVIAGAVLLLLGSGGNGLSKQLQHLSLRVGSLQALVESPEVKKNLKSEELLQVTTELRLSLTSSKNELTPLMIASGMPTKFDKGVVASEADISTTTKLEEAALNNRFDVAYAETLTQKISSLRALLTETFRLTKNTKLKKAMITLDDTLASTKKRIDGLNL